MTIKTRYLLFSSVCAALAFTSCKQSTSEALKVAKEEAPDDSIQITIHPEQTRSISGVSELDRNVYFAMCEPGGNFEAQARTPEVFDYLTKELDVRMGRMLGPVQSFVKYSQAVKEDPNRPGFMDIDFFKSRVEGKNKEPSAKMREAFGDNLDVAAHGNHNVFPEFMGKFYSEEAKKDPKHSEYIPENLDAAAELSATVFKYGFNDFTRPRYYEPLNEPHWSYYSTDQLAQWHLKTHAAVKAATPEVQVGGLCMAVAYFYNELHRIWGGFRDFMVNTEGKLDFYSLHVYDYYRAPEAAPDNESRITSGLPFEGVLDLINNHAQIEFGRDVDIVVSEHGGYALSVEKPKERFDGDAIAEMIYENVSNKKEGFAAELEKRDIATYLHLSTIVTNTLAFMDHPHSIKKAVPFILLNTEGWDSKYYASVYVPTDYKVGGEWNESFLLNFYKFFRGVDGRRIVVDSTDPDLQVRSFVDGNKVYTAINNLSLAEHQITLNGLDKAKHEIRRIRRGPEFIPTYTESALDSTKGLKILSRDAVMIVSTFDSDVTEKSIVEEKIFYGDKLTQQIDETTKEAKINIKVPNAGDAKSAILRVGISRLTESLTTANVTLNGTPLEVPLEDAANRYNDSRVGYGTTKLIPIPAGLLSEENTITVTFDDDKKASIGSAVIRAQF